MRPKSTRAATAIIASLAIGTLLAACGGAAATKAPAVTVAPLPSSVDVAMQEWAMVPGATVLAAGPVTFHVSNTGPKDKHEMVVVRTDLANRKLPVLADGSVDEEAGVGITAIGEIEDVLVGTSGDVTLTLPAGHYVMFCNLVDDQGIHYAKGMSADFETR